MGMKVKVTGNVNKVFLELLRKWPSFNYGLLSHIGYVGRRALYTNFLRGQVINLTVYRKDVRGRPTVSYGIARNRKSVKISSYPLNLFEPRRVYNSARSTVESAVTASLSHYDERVLQKRLNQIDKAAKL